MRKAASCLFTAAVITGLSMVSALIISPITAAAAEGDVEISDDGTTFAATYPGFLFDNIAVLVPGDSDHEEFYLRNSGTEPGHLRITLGDVVASDADFAGALTLSANTAGYAGVEASLLEANPCWVLLEGKVVAPGEAIRVSTTMALGQLDGQSGQGATAQLALHITLTSAAAQLPPTSCGSSDTTIPVLPPAPGQPNQSAPVPDPNSGAGSPREPENVDSDDAGADLPVLSPPNLLGIDPNTWRLFEEYFVFVLIGGFIAGTVWFAVVAWRRRHNEADPEAHEGVTE